MIRILVMSDSHGNANAIRRALAEEPDVSAVIHLGDGAREAHRVQADHMDKTWHIVRGNCDFGVDEEPSLLVTVGGKRLFLTHGHAQHVKSDLLRLTMTGREQQADVILFGHTHVPTTEFFGGMLLFNPGSIDDFGHYGILEIADGVYEEHRVLSQNSVC